MDEAGRHDLDETRRLLYMALAARDTEKYDLAGTLTNALAHHGHGVHPDEAFSKTVAAITGDAGARTWVQERIAAITRQVEELPARE